MLVYCEKNIDSLIIYFTLKLFKMLIKKSRIFFCPFQLNYFHLS
jgi:hypothetical protein